MGDTATFVFYRAGLADLHKVLKRCLYGTACLYIGLLALIAGLENTHFSPTIMVALIGIVVSGLPLTVVLLILKRMRTYSEQLHGLDNYSTGLAHDKYPSPAEWMREWWIDPKDPRE
jgi:hypothetical protein